MSTPDSHPRLPEADAVLLSAYLDGELDEAARAGLEKRLAAEPVLREELEALRAAHDVFVQAAKPESSRAPAASESFASFGSRLAQAVPGELPVASALPPAYLRRAVIVCVLVLGTLLAASFALRVFSRLGGPQPTGWGVLAQGARVSFVREGRVLTAEGYLPLQAGDLFVLPDAQSEVVLVGPGEVKVSARGPARLTVAYGELEVAEGKLTVEGTGVEAAQSAKLRTPDGLVRPKVSEGAFKFDVDVPLRK